ncbi:MAG: flagellar basal body protein [Hyphomicrobiaceae bacterium]|uniref:flagellar basal body protein n=1 Tax=Pseudorhodoplanes sp. TaxID=1934341 RepID=UPI003D152599
MSDLAVFQIGHDRARWLAARVAVVAANVANADTPGYRAKDIAPFGSILNEARIEMRKSQAGHLAPEQDMEARFGVGPREGAVQKHSGNSVSLEAEMAALGEAKEQQSAVTAILGVFHRMLLSSSRG